MMYAYDSIFCTFTLIYIHVDENMAGMNDRLKAIVPQKALHVLC